LAQLSLVDFRLLLGRRVDVFVAGVAVDDRARVRVLVLLVRTQVAAVEVERDLGINGVNILRVQLTVVVEKLDLPHCLQHLQFWHL